MTDKPIPNALQAVIAQHHALTTNVEHLTAENASLYRVFEVALQLAHSQSDWTPEQREQLVLAVKACNDAPATAKAIRAEQANGMIIARDELAKQLNEGVDVRYRPGIDVCLGLVTAKAQLHRMAR